VTGFYDKTERTYDNTREAYDHSTALYDKCRQHAFGPLPSKEKGPQKEGLLLCFYKAHDLFLARKCRNAPFPAAVKAPLAFANSRISACRFLRSSTKPSDVTPASSSLNRKPPMKASPAPVVSWTSTL
jgi:hypothetical protein